RPVQPPAPRPYAVSTVNAAPTSSASERHAKYVAFEYWSDHMTPIFEPPSSPNAEIADVSSLVTTGTGSETNVKAVPPGAVCPIWTFPLSTYVVQRRFAPSIAIVSVCGFAVVIRVGPEIRIHAPLPRYS